MVGIGVGYAFEHRVATMTLANRDRVIESLRQDVAAAEADKQAEIQRVKKEMLQMVAEVQTSTPTASVEAFGPTVLPKKGDRFCRGDELTVIWNVNEIVDEVRVWVNTPFPSQPIIDAPATWNELGVTGRGDVTWTVGEAKVGTTKMDIPDGELYRINIDALSGGKVVGTQESGNFTIETCQG